MSFQIQDEKSCLQDNATTSICASSIPRDGLDRHADISQWSEFTQEVDFTLDVRDTRSVDFEILSNSLDSWDNIDNVQYCMESSEMSCYELDEYTESDDFTHWAKLDKDWLSSDYDKEWEEDMERLKNTP
jgi:hypothetical protein